MGLTRLLLELLAKFSNYPKFNEREKTIEFFECKMIYFERILNLREVLKNDSTNTNTFFSCFPESQSFKTKLMRWSIVKLKLSCFENMRNP